MVGRGADGRVSGRAIPSLITLSWTVTPEQKQPFFLQKANLFEA